jgi:hypothetical protein
MGKVIFTKKAENRLVKLVFILYKNREPAYFHTSNYVLQSSFF